MPTITATTATGTVSIEATAGRKLVLELELMLRSFGFSPFQRAFRVSRHLATRL